MNLHIKQRIFVEDKDYLVDGSGKKLLKFGFDELKILNDNLIYYRIGNKCNIVTKAFVLSNKNKLDYTMANFDKVIKFPTFYLLLSEVGGIKLVDCTGKIKNYHFGKIVYSQKNRYAVIKNEQELLAIYCAADGTNIFEMNQVELQEESDCNKFSFNFPILKLNFASEEEIASLLAFFKILTEVDIQNYNKPTNKYVLADQNQVVFGQANKDASQYYISLKEVCFDSEQQAKINAKNVLNYYQIKSNLALNKAKQKRARVEASQFSAGVKPN